MTTTVTRETTAGRIRALVEEPLRQIEVTVDGGDQHRAGFVALARGQVHVRLHERIVHQIGATAGQNRFLAEQFLHHF